ncbi:MAG: molybdopterin molybdotransferase MoeA [Candidatus Asgardarchaeia archaeon]
MSASHKMRGFKKLTKLEDALATIRQEVSAINEIEKVKLDDAIGRVVAEDIFSPADIPPFDRSAVDGYAVKSKDVLSSSYANPSIIEIIDESLTGFPSKISLGNYQGIYVSTGAKMPSNADAVVPVEYSRKISNNKILIFRPVAPGENVSVRGEDIAKGAIIVSKGQVIKPYDYAFLAAAQVTEVKVIRKIRVGMIVTGSELITPYEKFDEGKIVDSLSYLVRGLFLHPSITFKHFGILPDNPSLIQEKVNECINDVDILILSGGTSVGKVDYSADVVLGIDNAKQLFHGVAIQPGKPIGVFKLEKSDKYLVLLPGYLVAAYFGLIKIVRELVFRLQGINQKSIEPVIKATLTRRVSTKLGIRTFVRVNILEKEGQIYADPVHASGSGLISTLSHADGYFEVPENMEGFEEGTEVEVKLFQDKIIPWM